ncbi:hypothetical protein MFFC18_34400 [Mariniblastus fucicola]|uniref:Uncharacterized protein n=1 Tax=Mariniblastus fucicola TaxID=980251 RepID=A0A5B9PDI7_9BACT|nr:hypothetical protein MFFC18_34400 [Mariniblastus fucicola]
MKIREWLQSNFECQSIEEKNDFKRKMMDVTTLTLNFAGFMEANPPKAFFGHAANLHRDIDSECAPLMGFPGVEVAQRNSGI